MREDEPTEPRPGTVFICYAREDDSLCRPLTRSFKALEMKGMVRAFRDVRIAEGSEWEPQIRGFLRSCAVGVVMVSEAALTSNYVLAHELPVLLERAERQEMVLVVVHAGFSNHDLTHPELGRYQWPVRDEGPLEALSEPERNALIRSVTRSAAISSHALPLARELGTDLEAEKTTRAEILTAWQALSEPGREPPQYADDNFGFALAAARDLADASLGPELKKLDAVFSQFRARLPKVDHAKPFSNDSTDDHLEQLRRDLDEVSLRFRTELGLARKELEALMTRPAIQSALAEWLAPDVVESVDGAVSAFSSFSAADRLADWRPLVDSLERRMSREEARSTAWRIYCCLVPLHTSAVEPSGPVGAAYAFASWLGQPIELERTGQNYRDPNAYVYNGHRIIDVSSIVQIYFECCARDSPEHISKDKMAIQVRRDLVAYLGEVARGLVPSKRLRYLLFDDVSPEVLEEARRYLSGLINDIGVEGEASPGAQLTYNLESTYTKLHEPRDPTTSGPSNSREPRDEPSSAIEVEPTPGTVFVSYSNEDRVSCERLMTAFKSFEDKNLVEVFRDERIPKGSSDWDAAIRSEVGSCAVAVFLESNASLASDYVRKYELEPMLDRTRQNAAVLLRVRLGPTSSKLTHPELAKIQMVNPRSRRKRLSESDATEAAEQAVLMSHALPVARDVYPHMDGGGVTRTDLIAACRGDFGAPAQTPRDDFHAILAVACHLTKRTLPLGLESVREVLDRFRTRVLGSSSASP